MEKTEIVRLARELVSEYSELAEWNLVISGRMTATAGKCDYDKRTISLSGPIMSLWPEESVRDTILHEIAHALVGYEAHHGPKWKAMCVKIGADPKARYSNNHPHPTAKWTVTCPTCKMKGQRHRRSNLSCGRCSDVFDPKHLLIWTENAR